MDLKLLTLQNNASQIEKDSTPESFLFWKNKRICNTVDFRSRRFACLRAVREPPQASPSGVSPVPSSRGRLRAFHSNQQGGFIHLRVSEKPSNRVSCKRINVTLRQCSAVDWSKWRRLQRGSNGRLRPRNEVRRLKRRPAESEANCEKKQRRLSNQLK